MTREELLEEMAKPFRNAAAAEAERRRAAADRERELRRRAEAEQKARAELVEATVARLVRRLAESPELSRLGVTVFASPDDAPRQHTAWYPTCAVLLPAPEWEPSEPRYPHEDRCRARVQLRFTNRHAAESLKRALAAAIVGRVRVLAEASCLKLAEDTTARISPQGSYPLVPRSGYIAVTLEAVVGCGRRAEVPPPDAPPPPPTRHQWKTKSGDWIDPSRTKIG